MHLKRRALSSLPSHTRSTNPAKFFSFAFWSLPIKKRGEPFEKPKGTSTFCSISFWINKMSTDSIRCFFIYISLFQYLNWKTVMSLKITTGVHIYRPINYVSISFQTI